MKIQIVSDLHREFGYTDLEIDLADVLILAGDIDIGIKGVEWLRSLKLDIPILYVLGNHEYYKGSYPKTLSKIKEAAIGTHINILENESIDIAGIRFHGTTLWTDFS